MRFVLSLAVVVASFAFTIVSANALEVRGTGAQYTQLVSQIVAEEITPVIKQLPAGQQERLKNIQINVVSDLGTNAMALAIDDTPPKILVNDHFIQGLSNYVEAYLVADLLKRPEYIEEHFSHYFWALHPRTNGVALVSPFQQYPELANNLLVERKQQLLGGAVLDVLLHELGHHAEGAFYHFRASMYVRRQHENSAEAWSDKVKAEYFPDSGLGQLISIGFIFEQTRWAKLARDTYYPRMLSAVTEFIPNNCEKSDSSEVLMFCDQLSEKIEQLYSGQMISGYELRHEQGDHFASFPLGQVEWAKSNFVDACYYFNESLVYGQVARAAIFVGWCYQKGYLEPSPPDAEVLALLNQNHGGSYGFSPRQQELTFLQ